MGIREHSQQVTGFSWQFKGKKYYFRDTKLPFRARLSVSIFHRLTQAVKRIMAQKGFDLIVVYLDDFLIISKSKEQCALALQVLIKLLRKLGFSIHWGKVVDPTQIITFLGIELDSICMSLRLPHDKLTSIREELQGFVNHKRTTKWQLPSLAGKLSWATSVVRGERVFLRRIFNQIGKLKCGYHRVLITSDIDYDIAWWLQLMMEFNGRSLLLDKRPTECVFTDACNEGAGGSFGKDWFYFNWSQDWPEAGTFHINEKEVFAVVLAAYRWAPFWKNKKIIIYSDNTVTVAAINKGTSRNTSIMKSLRSLFWLSVAHNYHLTTKFIQGARNVAADSASRLHLPGHLETLLLFTDLSPLPLHMTPQTFNFLLHRYPYWWSRLPQTVSESPIPGGTLIQSGQRCTVV